MSRTTYVNFNEINDLQYNIMVFIGEWVHKEKTPIPRKEIIINMQKKGVKDYTVIKAINSLLNKGYIRRSVTISNKSSYVQLRSL